MPTLTEEESISVAELRRRLAAYRSVETD